MQFMRVISGNQLVNFADYSKAVRAVVESLPENPNLPAPWFGTVHPANISINHTLYAGDPRTGKSTMMERMMCSVLKDYVGVQGYDHRALIIDHKQNIEPSLAGMGLPYVVMNPSLTGTFAWDMASDIDNPDDAEYLAEALLEDDNKEEAFWRNGSLALLSGVIASLITIRSKKWDLLEVLRAANLPPADLKKILLKFPPNEEIFDTIGRDDKLLDHMRATLYVKLCKYRKVASVWAVAPRSNRLTLKTWVTQQPGTVLVLSSHHKQRPSVVPLYKVMARCLKDLILDLDDAPNRRRIWLFLDEASQSWKFPGLEDILREGPGRGVCVTMCIQDYVRIKEVYGKDSADTILGLFGSKAFFRSISVDTQCWMSKCLGEQEVILRLPSEQQNTAHRTAPNDTANQDGEPRFDVARDSTYTESAGWSDTRVERPVMQPSEFGLLPSATLGDRAVAILTTPLGTTRVEMPWEWADGHGRSSTYLPPRPRDFKIRGMATLRDVTYRRWHRLEQTFLGLGERYVPFAAISGTRRKALDEYAELFVQAWNDVAELLRDELLATSEARAYLDSIVKFFETLEKLIIDARSDPLQDRAGEWSSIRNMFTELLQERSRAKVRTTELDQRISAFAKEVQASFRMMVAQLREALRPKT